MPLSGPDIASEIQRDLRRLTVATVILYLLLSCSVAYVTWSSRAQQDRVSSGTERSTRALCALRSDLHSRVASSQAFLVAHPYGLPELGITVSFLQSSIDGQRRTITALGIVECPKL